MSTVPRTGPSRIDHLGAEGIERGSVGGRYDRLGTGAEPADGKAAVGSDRVLVAVLVTDIVGATRWINQLGDHRWGRLLEHHHSVVRRELERFGGREVDTAGDGFLAVFAAPGRAIRCACAISDALRPLGLQIRAGLHAGECEQIAGKPGGIAIHIGARVAASAAPGQILVSRTVKELVAGSDITFEERGPRPLKGLLGEWPLFAVRHDGGDASAAASGTRRGRTLAFPARSLVPAATGSC